MTFLAIELLDEFVAAVVGAVWPLIRTDLELSYVQIGVLPSAPAVFAYLIEPAIGILGDVWNRLALILGGGVAFGAALVFVSATPGFLFLLPAFTLLHPASDAFVSLSQASFVDYDPTRLEHNMALDSCRYYLRGAWGTCAGTIGRGGSEPTRPVPGASCGNDSRAPDGP